MTKNCIEECKKAKTPCENIKCRYWMEYSEELNCAIVSIENHGAHTLQQVGDRLSVSAVRIKQIQDKALIKIKSFIKNTDVS